MRRFPPPFSYLVPSALILYVAICLIGGSAFAQRQPRRRPVTRRVITPPAIDYSKFSHATKKHQAACDTCHKVPTDNWKKVSAFPDVADYPGHDACVSCHRPQFFRGAKPPICSVCHSRVSPRDDVRFAFRNPASPRQFLIEFPHDKHQDVIARLQRQPHPAQAARVVGASFNPASAVTQTVRDHRPGSPVATPAAPRRRGPRAGVFASSRAWSHSRFASGRPPQTNSLRYQFVATQAADNKTKQYNNCEICHGPRTTTPVAPATGWPDSFVPDPATFRAVPTSHEACFNCHWKSQPPISENCAGCHKLGDKPYKAGPADPPQRLSFKFRHAREQHLQECTTCHINITKASTLRGLQPDVPITSCTECHNKDGLRLDVSGELEAIDKNRNFVCSYCHTSNVGRLDAPPSHYLIAGREAVKRRDAK